MSFYNDAILPRLCHFAMRNPQLVPYRERVAGAGMIEKVGFDVDRMETGYMPGAEADDIYV